MSRVNKMQSELDNESVNFNSFMTVIRNNKLPVCFEGKDIQYYRIRIERYLTENFDYIACNGKCNVLNLRNKIKEHSIYKNKLCLYFVDCDFDDNSDITDESDIYITPSYSIENLYLSDSTFKKILSDEFGIKDNNEEQKKLFDQILSLFQNRKKEFLIEIQEFNYYIYCIKKQNRNISYNDIKLSKLIHLELDTLSKNYRHISDIFPTLQLQAPDLALADSYFKSKDPEKYFRGKNNLMFLECFLEKLRNDAIQKNIERKVFLKKTTVEFTTNNLLSNCCKYAETPQCLIDFLEIYRDIIQ